MKRRSLPHWFMPGAVHFVTYRLAGTIPPAVMDAWRAEREQEFKRSVPPDQRSERRINIHKRFFAKFDQYLDLAGKIDWLVQPAIAAMIRENLYFHDGRKYHLLAFCVMPNHMHILIQPLFDTPGSKELSSSGVNYSAPSSPLSDANCGCESVDAHTPLAKIMHSIKSYTANCINQQLGRSGQLWQHESYDHWIRDLDELERVAAYIAANPVKARMAEKPEQWQFSSAHDRHHRDGMETSLLKAPSGHY